VDRFADFRLGNSVFHRYYDDADLRPGLLCSIPLAGQRVDQA
jgi:hypothetical protein